MSHIYVDAVRGCRVVNFGDMDQCMACGAKWDAGDYTGKCPRFEDSDDEGLSFWQRAGQAALICAVLSAFFFLGVAVGR